MIQYTLFSDAFALFFYRGISLPRRYGKGWNHPVALGVIRRELALERNFPSACRRHPCSSFSPSPLGGGEGGGGEGGGAPPPGGGRACQAEPFKLGQARLVGQGAKAV